MGKPNSARKIRERRENILLLMSRGMKQIDIARKLGVTVKSIQRDMAYINDMARHGLYGMGKTTATLCYNCIQGLDECLDVCWHIHDNVDNNPEINQWHKIAAVRLAASINEKKFNIVMNGPSILELDKLKEKLNKLRNDVFSMDNNNNSNNDNPLGLGLGLGHSTITR